MLADIWHPIWCLTLRLNSNAAMEIWDPPISAFWLRRNSCSTDRRQNQPCVGDIGGIEPVEDLFRRQCAKNTIDDPVQRIPVGKAVRIVDEA